MLEESVNLPESEQVVSDTRQTVLCRENKDELNENASLAGKDF